MMNTDKRVDSYIENANAFAKPILNHLRKLVHAACPDVEEGIKWGFPAFEYHGYMCGMAAHKAHCSFTFWKGTLLDDPSGILEVVGKTGMGQLGRITSVNELPEDEILEKYIRQAVELNKKGVKSPGKSNRIEEIETPAYIKDALKAAPGALTHYENFSNYNKKEYIDWIMGAKTDATMQKRLKQAVEWIAEGKPRNWKYQK